MNYKYIQAAPNSDGSVRFQVVTDSFPLGYMSGNCSVDEAPNEGKCYVPSMRGSGRRYMPCYIEDGEVFTEDHTFLCYAEAMEDALSAPTPSYSSSDVEAVCERVELAIKCASASRSVEKSVDSSDLASKIASAIVAVLRETGIGSK